MDDRRWTDWDSRCPHKEDSTRNPYYNQPTHSPYKGQGFAVASMVCGILSMMLTCLAIVPFILGAFSLLFASLAYRKGKRRNNLVFYGLVSSGFGMISAIIMLVQIFTMQLDGTQIGAYQQYLQEYYEQQR